jgi:hypothetical protein
MPLAAGKEVFKTQYKLYLETLATNVDENKANTIDEHVDTLANLVEDFIKSAIVNVPGTGLVAPTGGGPVTGASITGSLE